MWNFKSLQKPLVFLFLLCLFPLGASAQGTITGTVNDEAGEPIIGASVQVLVTMTGAITDFNGNFSVQAGSDATLVISYIGYTSATVKVNGRNNITVVLKEDAQTLSDVVVIGYGVQKKSDLTGAVASVMRLRICRQQMLLLLCRVRFLVCRSSTPQVTLLLEPASVFVVILRTLVASAR